MYLTDIFSLLWGAAIGLALPVLAIILLIKLVRAHQAGTAHDAFEKLKRSSLGIAIAIILPLFLHFLISSLVPGVGNVGEARAFAFGLGLALGLGAFLLGLVARRAPVVGNGIAIGGLIYTIYAVTVNFTFLSSVTQLVILILALLATIFFGYMVHFRDVRLGKVTPTLSGVGGFGVGFLTFLFSNITISTAVVAVEELTGNATDPYGYLIPATGYETRQFIVVLSLAIIYLLVGLAVRTVKPVSSGLVLAGILSLIAAIFVSFDQVDKFAAVITTGIVLVFLIGFGYYKFSHTNEDQAPPQQ